MASAWTSVRGPADLYAETARAVLHAAGGAPAELVVTTQSRHLTVASLLHTAAVEAAIHQLDLAPALDERPHPDALSAVRHVLDGLLGTPAPTSWDDARYVLVGTGRAPLTEAERRELGPLADRLPAFG